MTKTRILAGLTHTARQQVVRVDREPEAEPNRHLKRELVLAAREYARASDVLLISDYGYGAATPANPECGPLQRTGCAECRWCSIRATACCNIPA